MDCTAMFVTEWLCAQQDSRPRNLGRGTSKPKKNTVASLLAQSRALGIKPSAGLDVSPLNHQVSILKSNFLGAQQSQLLPASNKGMIEKFVIQKTKKLEIVVTLGGN